MPAKTISPGQKALIIVDLPNKAHTSICIENVVEGNNWVVTGNVYQSSLVKEFCLDVSQYNFKDGIPISQGVWVRLGRIFRFGRRLAVEYPHHALCTVGNI